jgi:hypothetical protein
LRFVLADWIAADQIARAEVAWVVAKSISAEDLAAIRSAAGPLLLPADCAPGIEVPARAVLYRTEDEAAAGLVSLLSR